MVAALLERARLRTMFWLRTAFAIAAMRGSSEAVPPKIWSRFALRVAWSHTMVRRGIVGCAELGGGGWSACPVKFVNERKSVVFLA